MHHDKFKITHLNPSWFIPAVGNILVPIAGTTHFTPELSWFYFSVGLFFWVILLVAFFYRIIFHESMTEKLLPTLFILIAPPAVGFISYYKLTGEINEFSRVLYYFSVFITILLMAQIKVFSKIKYYLSWWAYSFPLASVSIASALMYHESHFVCFKYLFLVLLMLLTMLILILTLRTVAAIARKEICLAE
jgi:tellurite resistance protein